MIYDTVTCGFALQVYNIPVIHKNGLGHNFNYAPAFIGSVH